MKVLARYTNVLLMALIIATALSVAGCHKTTEFDQGLPSDEGIEGWFDFAEGPGEGEAAEGEAVVGEEAEPEVEAEAEAEPEPEPESELEPYSVQSQQIIKRDSSLIEFTDKPIPLILQIITKLSRPLSADEKSQFETEFHLQDSDGNDVAGSFAWVNDEEVRFGPKRRLAYGKTYTTSPAAATDHFTTMTKGDINGDGVADVLVGESGFASSRGRVHVLSGASLPATIVEIPPAPLMGEDVEHRFGAAVTIAGDINADGYEDIVVGAPGYDTPIDSDIGKAYVYFGPDLALAASVMGDMYSSELGAAVAGCPLVGHEFVEVIVGAPGFSMQKGMVKVLKGSPSPSVTAVVQGADFLHEFGWSLACLGDHDGDGAHDLLIGSPMAGGNKGKISLHRSSDLTFISERKGQPPNDFRYGEAIARISDLDGDKNDDIIVGSPNSYSEKGMVYVYAPNYAATDQAQILPTAAGVVKGQGEFNGDHYGKTVMAIPDITGEGNQDILIGAPNFFVTQGKVYSASTSGSSLETVKAAMGDAPDAGMGNALALTKDLDGDGKQDVLVGESGWAGQKGRVLLLHVGDISAPSINHLDGETVGDLIGVSAAGP